LDCVRLQRRFSGRHLPACARTLVEQCWAAGVYRHCNEDSIPPELTLLAQAGRELGIELVCDTSTPEKLNGSLTGACTEIVLFRLMTPMSVKAMQNIFSYAGIAEDARAACCALPLGSFKGWNRISGGSLGGKVF
jgi:hypothetical protein